jgi:hypothetical protein
MTALNAICRSVFAPRTLIPSQAEYGFVARYGWILVIVRWAYYSIVFHFRDYRGQWAPFWPLPLGMDLDTYAWVQRSLSLPFGLVLMLLLGLALTTYLRLIGKNVRFLSVLNILGVSFFLPFALVQPLDLVMIALVGWRFWPVTLLHSSILLWESWATMEIISGEYAFRQSERLVGIVVLCGTWIAVAGPVWR